jgi:hypothetical protein
LGERSDPNPFLRLLVERLRSYLISLIETFTPYSKGVLIAGCEEYCRGVDQWPINLVLNYVWGTLWFLFLRAHVGAWPEVTSAHRCGPCNEERGGASLSRHLGGQPVEPGSDVRGEPYAAYDIQWPTALYAEWIWDRRQKLADRFREWSGWDRGVGIIIYGRRLHIDLRDRDYFEDKR